MLSDFRLQNAIFYRNNFEGVRGSVLWRKYLNINYKTDYEASRHIISKPLFGAIL
jgi:hypothetical protein